MYRADLSRRVGPAFADAAVDAAMDSLDKHGYPEGWGTSPRPAPTAASYKPAHGGYPGTPRCCATRNRSAEMAGS